MANTALVIIDIENEFFPGGKMVLPYAERAGKKAAKVLRRFRKNKQPIFFVHHSETDPESPCFVANSEGVKINSIVEPKSSEPVFEKHFPNAFRETPLLERLQQEGVTDLVFCGNMTNMCIDATVRAAFDFGFNCTVIEDACAACDLELGKKKVKHTQVQAAFMAALAAAYATVITAQDFLNPPPAAAEPQA